MFSDVYSIYSLCDVKACPDKYAAIRQDVLSRMRTSWGDLRREAEKKRAELAAPSWPFLDSSDEDLDLAARVPTPSHLHGMVEELRAIWAEKIQDSPGTDFPRGQINGESDAKRRDLLAEIASQHFRSGMQSWLTGITPDQGLSATPIGELEQIKSEMRYRLKLVNVIAAMTERDIEALDTQIEGKRAPEKPCVQSNHAMAKLLIMLSPRSFSSVGFHDDGRHPDIYETPRAAYLRWRHRSGDHRFRRRNKKGHAGPSGLLRTLAQIHDGVQTNGSALRAIGWLHDRRDCSPRNSWTISSKPFHQRLVWKKVPSRRERLCFSTSLWPTPDAYYLHLTRHPVSTRSSWNEFVEDNVKRRKDGDRSDHMDRLIGWHHMHTILRFTSSAASRRFSICALRKEWTSYA